MGWGRRLVFWRWGTAEGRGWAAAGRRGGGCRAGRGSSVIRAEIDGKGRHRRQRESIKREDHIRGDRESFKLQGLLPPRGVEGGSPGAKGGYRVPRGVGAPKDGSPALKRAFHSPTPSL